MQAKYYNDSIFKEHKDYFKKQMVKAEKSIHNHSFMGNYRPTDKMQYCFDRTYHKNNNDLIKHQRKLYEPMTGKHQNLHGVHNWLSVLGKNDKYATTGRAAENAAAKLEKAFKDQGKWVSMQVSERERAKLRPLRRPQGGAASIHQAERSGKAERSGGGGGGGGPPLNNQINSNTSKTL